MTTAKWIKKQLSFGMNNIDDLEDLKDHIQMVLIRLELSPLDDPSIKGRCLYCLYARYGNFIKDEDIGDLECTLHNNDVFSS